MEKAENRARMNNHIHCFVWDTITYHRLNFNDGLAKQPLELDMDE